MFRKMLRWLHGALGRTFNTNRDGDSSVSVTLSQDMEAAIDLWSKMYSEGGPWVGDDKKSLGLPAAISSEFARLTVLERKIEIIGSARAKFLNDQLTPFFDKRLRESTEYGCAIGSIIFKPFVSGDNVIVDVVQGDCFVPTEFDTSNRLAGAIFSEQLCRDKKIFTRFEKHSFSNKTHYIESKAFVSTTAENIGKEISLTEVAEWTDISPSAKVENVDRPLFGYFRVPFANPIDRHSPLGVSVFSRATNLIKQADTQYGRLLWEYEGGELAIDAADDYLMDVEGAPARMPKNKERLFRRLGTKDQNFYNVFAPSLRDESLRKGLDDILKRIEFNCSLAYGTLSDPKNVDKTAEEIRSSKQRSYTAVADIQSSLQAALDDLIYAVDKLATASGLAPSGTYRVQYTWDDSIIADPDVEYARRMGLVEAGILKPELLLGWYFGLPAETEKDIAYIRESLMPAMEDMSDYNGTNNKEVKEGEEDEKPVKPEKSETTKKDDE